MKNENRYFNRELSWLSFNERVLQEAENTTIPVMDRLKFLAIFSSNLDEFFRVRVASIRSVAQLDKDERATLDLKPNTLLTQIRTQVQLLQERFGRVYRQQIVPELNSKGVIVCNEHHIPAIIKKHVHSYASENVLNKVELIAITSNTRPTLDNRKLYLVVQTQTSEGNEELYLMKVPSVSRFHYFSDGLKHYVFYTEDLIREGLEELLPEREIMGCYSISLSRDAGLYLEDEYSGDMLEAIKRSLGKRNTGLPVRLLFDANMPYSVQQTLLKALTLSEEDRYHHFTILCRLKILLENWKNSNGLRVLHIPLLPAMKVCFMSLGSRTKCFISPSILTTTLSIF